MNTPVLIALAVYAIVALILTRGVVIDSGLSVFQKIMQLFIVWLIPVLGMSIVLLMQGNNHTRAEMKRLVPFPFYLAAPSGQSDRSSSSYAQDSAEDYSGADFVDGD